MPNPAPPRLYAGDRFAIQTFAGIATGLAIAAVIDWAIGGPGLLTVFGL